MEEFNQLNENSNHRGSFFYKSALLAGNSSHSNHGRSTTGGSPQTQIAVNNFPGDCFQPDPIVKTEAFTSMHRDRKLDRPLIGSHQSYIHRTDEASNDVEAIKAKISAHPKYSNLLEAYMDCQKVGAPPEVAASLAEARREFVARQRTASRDNSKDSELDQFMEAYYDILVKYREEITRPIQEATDFMHRIESQLDALCNGPIQIFTSDEKCEGNGSSENDQDNSGGETELPEMNPRAEEDRELKNQLLRKYSGYLSSLKQELSKKKKKAKLPRDARQKLLNWWELHYKWPYPSETEKAALAESTGLDLKQINNWFINQRKRHWKPSEDAQFMVMGGGGVYPPSGGGLCMDSYYMANPHYRLGP